MADGLSDRVRGAHRDRKRRMEDVDLVRRV